MKGRYGKAVGCGASRRAFRHKNIIIKVPVNEAGVWDNQKEARVYRDFKKGLKPFYVPAACKLIVDKQSGLPILFMERLIPFRRTWNISRLPEWVNDLCDAGLDFFQVGKSLTGEIKCYDYAME